MVMNSTLEQLFKEFSGDTVEKKKWQEACTSKIYEEAKGGALDLIVPGLVGKDGAVGVADTGREVRREDIWGINIALCNEYCSREQIPMVFNYETFLARMTNYLLPWLALTAQLPYETGDTILSFMSLFIALGSPMLLVFSLTMTIFNRRWLRKRRKRFVSRFPDGPLVDRVKSATVLLKAAQQAPLRMVQDGGWFASLVLLDSNSNWWRRLSDRLRLTKRKASVSLVAQLTVALVAFIMTTVGSFGTRLGDHAEALAFSSSTLWTWLVPAVCGWVIVGTQGHADGVSEALRADTAYCAPTTAGGDLVAREQQGCFRVADADAEAAREHNLAGFSIDGDEIKLGPAYNYARMHTWRRTAQQLFRAFETAAENLDNNLGLDGNLSDVNGNLTLSHLQNDPNFNRHSLETYCGLQQQAANSAHGDVDADFRWQVIGATLTAAVVQWGTTGAAVAIAYLTDTKGLGCRSGSYLIYGVASTAAFLCLVMSAVCSRHALRRAGRSPKGFAFHFFRALAVGLRLLGRVLVLANATWLVVASMFELVGFYDNCWCEGVVFQRGEAAFVVLFKSAVDLAESARPSWGGGVALSGGIMLLSPVWFWLLCRKSG